MALTCHALWQGSEGSNLRLLGCSAQSRGMEMKQPPMLALHGRQCVTPHVREIKKVSLIAPIGYHLSQERKRSSHGCSAIKLKCLKPTQLGTRNLACEKINACREKESTSMEKKEWIHKQGGGL